MSITSGLGVKKKSFPDLNKDGKVTKADILKGRGVEGFQEGGSPGFLSRVMSNPLSRDHPLTGDDAFFDLRDPTTYMYFGGPIGAAANVGIKGLKMANQANKVYKRGKLENAVSLAGTGSMTGIAAYEAPELAAGLADIVTDPDIQEYMLDAVTGNLAEEIPEEEMSLIQELTEKANELRDNQSVEQRADGGILSLAKGGEVLYAKDGSSIEKTGGKGKKGAALGGIFNFLKKRADKNKKRKEKVEEPAETPKTSITDKAPEPLSPIIGGGAGDRALIAGGAQIAKAPIGLIKSAARNPLTTIALGFGGAGAINQYGKSRNAKKLAADEKKVEDDKQAAIAAAKAEEEAAAKAIADAQAAQDAADASDKFPDIIRKNTFLAANKAGRETPVFMDYVKTFPKSYMEKVGKDPDFAKQMMAGFMALMKPTEGFVPINPLVAFGEAAMAEGARQEGEEPSMIQTLRALNEPGNEDLRAMYLAGQTKGKSSFDVLDALQGYNADLIAKNIIGVLGGEESKSDSLDIVFKNGSKVDDLQILALLEKYSDDPKALRDEIVATMDIKPKPIKD